MLATGLHVELNRDFREEGFLVVLFIEVTGFEHYAVAARAGGFILREQGADIDGVYLQQ